MAGRRSLLTNQDPHNRRPARTYPPNAHFCAIVNPVLFSNPDRQALKTESAGQDLTARGVRRANPNRISAVNSNPPSAAGGFPWVP